MIEASTGSSIKHIGLLGIESQSTGSQSLVYMYLLLTAFPIESKQRTHI